MKPSRSLQPLVAALLMPMLSPSQAQGPDSPNEGLQITASSPGAFSLSWWGRAGNGYFIQYSLDLETWRYLPIVDGGADDIIAWGFQNAASAYFLRLVRVPGYDATAVTTNDSDGDGFTDAEELEQLTDPFDGTDKPPPLPLPSQPRSIDPPSDADEDGVPDSEDAVPYDPDLTFRPGRLAQAYVLTDLGVPDWGALSATSAAGHVAWRQGSQLHVWSPQDASTQILATVPVLSAGASAEPYWANLMLSPGGLMATAATQPATAPAPLLYGALHSAPPFQFGTWLPPVSRTPPEYAGTTLFGWGDDTRLYAVQHFTEPPTSPGSLATAKGQSFGYYAIPGGFITLATTPPPGADPPLPVGFRPVPNPVTEEIFIDVGEGGLRESFQVSLTGPAGAIVAHRQHRSHCYDVFELVDPADPSLGGSWTRHLRGRWKTGLLPPEQWQTGDRRQRPPGTHVEDDPASATLTYKLFTSAGTQVLLTRDLRTQALTAFSAITTHSPAPWLAGPTLAAKSREDFVDWQYADQLWIPDGSTYSQHPLYGSQARYDEQLPLEEILHLNGHGMAVVYGKLEDGSIDYGVWSNGIARSLQQLIPASQWDLYDENSWYLCALTDDGNIIATATRNGQTHLLFLTIVELLQQPLVGDRVYEFPQPTGTRSPRFSRWQGAFDPSTGELNPDWLDSDPDRLFLRVYADVVKDSLPQVNIKTTEIVDAGVANDAGALDLTKEDGIWSSQPLILVVDQTDDVTYNGAGSENGQKDQTRRAGFNSKVTATFQLKDQTVVELELGRVAPAVFKAKVNLVYLRGIVPVGPADLADMQQRFDATRRLYRQVHIELEAQGEPTILDLPEAYKTRLRLKTKPPPTDALLETTTDPDSGLTFKDWLKAKAEESSNVTLFYLNAEIAASPTLNVSGWADINGKHGIVETNSVDQGAARITVTAHELAHVFGALHPDPSLNGKRIIMAKDPVPVRNEWNFDHQRRFTLSDHWNFRTAPELELITP